MSSARLIWLTSIFLAISVAAFTIGWGGRLDAILRGNVPVMNATPIESFSRAQAGRPVQVPKEVQPVTYEVISGDSWSSIAKSHHINDYNELARYFNFVPLKPGLRLTIPGHLMERP